ncbi:MAG: peptidoglycan DD-metalloendopeptidase family protein [Polyangiales bacterium]
MTTLDTRGCSFATVIAMPEGYEVYDFTAGYDPARALRSPYGVGRYDEKRRGMYTAALFEGARDVHMGVDLAAPVGTAVHAFADGAVHRFGYNPAPGDYGYTLVTRHEVNGTAVYALHGHLAARSLEGRFEGQPVARGEVIAWLGDRHENGGWNPHLHFQLSLVRPEVPDLPGVVSERDREEARRRYPDPRLVLGPLY